MARGPDEELDELVESQERLRKAV
ncbi:Protein of unknown function [Propionibacterium freudenreichii]|nr:Protein of unknown function [Propionibacterium freudenreichii]